MEIRTHRPRTPIRIRVTAAPAAPRERPRPAAAPPASWRTRLADRVAEAFLGPEVPAFRGQLAGPAGRIANRLDKGQSVMLAATGSATVPTALLAQALPGGAALPDLGGSLRMAGMLTRKNDGKLLLTLTFQASESASRASGDGISAGVTIGGRRYGFKLGGERAIGGELSQLAVVTLKFDPRDPADAGRLADMLAPGADGPGAALSRALAHNRTSLSLGGVLGGNLGFTLGGNVGELDPTDGLGVAADSPWAIKAKLGLVASAAGEVFRTWTRDGAVTDMLSFEGGLEGGLKLPAYVRGKLTSRAASSFSVTRGRDGRLAGLAAVFTDAVSARGLANVPGFDLGGKVAVKHVRTRELNAAGLAAAQRLLDAGVSPIAAYVRVAADPAMVEETVVSVGQRTLMAGLDGAIALAGHRLVLTGLLAAGRVQRRTADDADPSLRELLAVLKGTLVRATI